MNTIMGTSTLPNQVTNQSYRIISEYRYPKCTEMSGPFRRVPFSTAMIFEVKAAEQSAREQFAVCQEYVL